MTRLRPVEAGDIETITAIYGHHVRHGSASFELEPPDPAEIAARWQAARAKAQPWLALTDTEGHLLGYASTGSYRPRPAYRFCVEDSVYLAPGREGKGLGRLLLSSLVDAAESAGFRQMIAVIGDSANRASIGLHAALGFRESGVLRDIGFKHGRWLDTVVMQRPLGPGATKPPEA